MYGSRGGSDEEVDSGEFWSEPVVDLGLLCGEGWLGRRGELWLDDLSNPENTIIVVADDR